MSRTLAIILALTLLALSGGCIWVTREELERKLQEETGDTGDTGE